MDGRYAYDLGFDDTKGSFDSVVESIVSGAEELQNMLADCDPHLDRRGAYHAAVGEEPLDCKVLANDA